MKSAEPGSAIEVIRQQSEGSDPAALRKAISQLRTQPLTLQRERSIRNVSTTSPATILPVAEPPRGLSAHDGTTSIEKLPILDIIQARFVGSCPISSTVENVPSIRHVAAARTRSNAVPAIEENWPSMRAEQISGSPRGMRPG